jgi:hypothetical protein
MLSTLYVEKPTNIYSCPVQQAGCFERRLK